MNFGPNQKNALTETNSNFLPKAQQFNLKQEYDKTKKLSLTSVFFLYINIL